MCNLCIDRCQRIWDPSKVRSLWDLFQARLHFSHQVHQESSERRGVFLVSFRPLLEVSIWTFTHNPSTMNPWTHQTIFPHFLTYQPSTINPTDQPSTLLINHQPIWSVPLQAFNLTLLIDAFVTNGLVKTSLEALGAGIGWVLVDCEDSHGRYGGMDMNGITIKND